MTRTVMILQLIVGVVLIQWHAIPFWTEEVDRHAGWALSIMVEILALSFWWSRNGALRLLALTATVILLAGPMYHVAKPVYQQLRAAQAGGQSVATTIALKRAALDAERQALDTFLANSKERTGWLSAIQTSRANILALNEDIARLEQSATTGQRIRWEEIAPIAMYLWVLLLVQVNNVRMVRILSASWPTQSSRRAARTVSNSPPVRVVRTTKRDGRRLGVALEGQDLQEAVT